MVPASRREDGEAVAVAGPRMLGDGVAREPILPGRLVDESRFVTRGIGPLSSGADLARREPPHFPVDQDIAVSELELRPIRSHGVEGPDRLKGEILSEVS